MMHQPIEQAARRPAMARKQEVGVVGFLEWAFGAEKARLTFDEMDRDAPPAVGVEYRLLERHQLGCRVDGGGWSRPADDADLVADIVANLPPEQGGRGMAILIAECARSGLTPDWMPGAAPRVVPRDWHVNRHGRHARSEVVGLAEVRTRRGLRPYAMRACPITYSPTLAQIHAARRAYLHWWSALHHLRVAFQCRDWRRHTITDAMPVLAPWKEDPKKVLTKV